MPIDDIVPFLPKADLVLVMTVHPGFGGQSFIGDCVPKISWVRDWSEENGRELEISVDGGVNPETGKVCTDAGATVLVAGSSLFKLDDMAPTISEWKEYGRTL